MRQKSDTPAKPKARLATAPPKPRDTAQDVIREFFSTLARVHGAPQPMTQEKP